MKKDAELINIAGARGSGKTTRQIELIEGRDRVIVLDPMGTFKHTGFITVGSLPSMYRKIKEGWHSGFKIYMHTPATEIACTEIMKKLAKDLFQIQQPYKVGRDKRKLTVVIDEAHKFFPNRQMSPEEQEKLEDILALGRHYGIEMIAATQRLSKLWTEYRGNSTQSYFFAQGSSADIQAVLSIIGNEYRDTLRNLEVHDYIHKGHGMNITTGRNNCNWERK